MTDATPPTLNPHEPPLLDFDRVSKWYGSVLAFNQVTLVLNWGITGLVGANGAGKSTLIKLATGQIRPSLGRVTIRGRDAFDWSARELVGYCPDHDAFYEDLTGQSFVLSMAKLCGYSREQARTLTGQVLDRVGMTAHATRKLRGYSKGMRQRIKLAQALLTDPPLLILDEPLSGIDPVGRQEMLALFQQLAQEGKCLLISSHELEELEKLTNHIVIMAQGRIAAVGSVQGIREMLDHYPLRVRIATDRPHELAAELIAWPELQGVDFDDRGQLIVRVRQPQQFFPKLNRQIVSGKHAVRELEPLDESTHAVLGYLLGGSGRT